MSVEKVCAQACMLTLRRGSSCHSMYKDIKLSWQSTQLHRHEISVSSPDTDLSVSTLDTKHMSVSTHSFASLRHQLITKRVSQSRSNTISKFRIFESSVDKEVHSTLKSERWKFLLKHYLDSDFPNIIFEYEDLYVRIREFNHSSVLRIPFDAFRMISN